MSTQQNAVAKTEQRALSQLERDVARQLPTMAHLLPSDIPIDKFRASLWLEMQRTPALGEECIPDSVISCIVKAATYGLMPGRDCHFLPFRNKKKGGKKEATFVPNYQGIQRALDRTGKVAKSFAHPVHARDDFEVDYLADVFSHKIPTGNRGPIVCYYGAILLKDGTKLVEVMTCEQIDEIRRRAPGGEGDAWQLHPVEMARKTALKRVAKQANYVSIQLQAFLAEEDERETVDKDPARIQAHVSDLFGDGDPSKEFEDRARAEAQQVQQVQVVDPEEEGRTQSIEYIAETAHNLGIKPTALGKWVLSQFQDVDNLKACTNADLVRIMTHFDTHGADGLTMDLEPVA